MKVILKFDDAILEDDVDDFVEDIASVLGVNQTRHLTKGTINAKSDVTNVIR